LISGHLAVGMAIKGSVPAAPIWALLVGAMFLDVLNPILFRVGVEPAEIGNWSHSMAMSLVWSLLLGALFIWKSVTVAVAVSVAVLSHFVLDAIGGSLALWPYSPIHVGLGLSQLFSRSWWFVELAIVFAGVLYYYIRSRERLTIGKWVLVAFVLFVHILNSPWLQPMQ
jgi:LexA-binding, inner membrane-associated putative hydrolase